MPGPVSDTMLSLPERMRSLAERGHPKATELIAAADEMDAAVGDFEVKKVVGAWARARRLWSECTGEPLI